MSRIVFKDSSLGKFIKPNVVVSKCLLSYKCRYNGEIIHDPFVERLRGHVNFIPVCPEMETGMGVPRDPIRIVLYRWKKILYQPATGTDLTVKMAEFSERYIKSLKDVDGFILKYRSPSCGPGRVKVYSGFKDQKPEYKGTGFFAEEALKCFKGRAVFDDFMLEGPAIRDLFLTRIFVFSEFRKVKSSKSMSALIDFHSRNKYLFMAYNQSRLKALGRIAANHERHPAAVVFKNYEDLLAGLFTRIPGRGKWINVLQHIFGYFSGDLSGEIKDDFKKKLLEFREGRLPLKVMKDLLLELTGRFKMDYILNQTFFSPYPEELRD